VSLPLKIKLKAKSSNKKHVITIVGISIILLVSLATTFTYIHRNTSNKITFKTYEPTYLPAESTITKKVVEIWQAPADSPAQDTIVLRLDAGKNIFIYEQDKDGGNTHCTKELDEETCITELTPRGQRYVLTTTKLPNQSIVQGVRWIKDNTSLYMHLSSKDGYGVDTINRAVDSFRPVKYGELPSVNLSENSF
jgi:hypothetical protein